MARLKAKMPSKPKAPSKPTAPSSLTLDLHAPGMTLLHRAGLGGLAATLRAMERARRGGRLRDHQMPEGPDLGGGYPWKVEPLSITLDWGEPAAAGDYLRRLFAFGFGIKDKLIDLPGTYRVELSRAVRAELQAGLLLTFLQHGNVRALNKQPAIDSYDPEGDGTSSVQLQFRACHAFRHQKGWNDLTTKGKLTSKPVRVEGPLLPGAAVRHNAFPTHTKIQEPVERALSLHFAPVGTLSLAASRGTGVLLVPEVTDLVAFARARPGLTPSTPRQCRIASSGDAALQAAVRLRMARHAGRGESHGVGALYAMVLAPTAWASQQKSRIQTLHVPPLRLDPKQSAELRRFDLAMRHLPPRVRSTRVRSKEQRVMRGRKTVGSETRWFWIDSIVRPLVADNLASGRRWYHNFTRLMADRTTHTRLEFERKGLQAMADEPDLHDDPEMTFITSMHRAIFLARGKIYADTMGTAAAAAKVPANQATKNRWNRLMDRTRLKLIGSKTAAQARGAVSELLARTGIVTELQDQEALRRVTRLVFADEWERVRDLALFALASYKRPSKADRVPGDDEGETSLDTDTDTDQSNPPTPEE